MQLLSASPGGADGASSNRRRAPTRTNQGMTYAVRFTYRGERHFVQLGG